MSDQRLTGRVALVTGSSSGLGRAIALRYAQEGAAVLCADLRPGPDPSGFDGAEPTHEAIRALGGRAAFAACDVTDAEQVDAAHDAAVRELGRLDIVVANAGISPSTHPLADEPWDDYRATIAVNQDGAWHTCRAAARVLGAQGEGGRIIVISSIGGLVGIAVGAHYVMSKHAVMGLVRVLSRQLAGSGITVNAINPGYARTQMNAPVLADAGYLARVEAETPMGRLAEPDDIAGAAYFLASADAAYVTGIALPVDGGYTAI